MNPKYIKLKETASTNTYLTRMADILPHATVIYTDTQSSGRGQRGNSWESAPGKNITFSLLLKNILIAPNRQFHISEAVSIAVVSVLSRYADGFAVKWPNDIYYHDYKICGILIENVIMGNSLSRSIVGIGININQDTFISDAPNPISLRNIIGTDTDLDAILHEICNEIATCLAPICDTLDEAAIADIHTQYLNSLYRKDNAFHPFTLPNGSSLTGKILDVNPDGRLMIETDAGETLSFYFKEIAFVVSTNAQ